MQIHLAGIGLLLRARALVLRGRETKWLSELLELLLILINLEVKVALVSLLLGSLLNGIDVARIKTGDLLLLTTVLKAKSRVRWERSIFIVVCLIVGVIVIR